MCGIAVTSRIEVIWKPAACNARKADSRPERLERLGDLDGQLTSWGNNETEERVHVLEQGLYDGDGERARFAGARLRKPNDILP